MDGNKMALFGGTMEELVSQGRSQMASESEKMRSPHDAHGLLPDVTWGGRTHVSQVI